MNEKASIAVWCGIEREICDDLPIKQNDDRIKFEVIDPDSNEVIDTYAAFEIDRIEPSEVTETGYFLSNRKYKNQYMSILPILSVVKKMLKKEIQEEQNFKIFIRSQLGFEVSNDELDEAVAQFKTKKFKNADERKWKRGLLDDEEKGKKACSQISDLIIFNRNRKRILSKENENGN